MGKSSESEEKYMEEKILKYLAGKFSIPAENIRSDTMLTDIGVDSMTLLSSLLELENEFGIKISDRDIENLVTVGDLIQMVSDKKKDTV